MKDYLGYTGKVCVVTGAASGMGKATAEMLVDLGARVYALDWAEVKVEGITAYLHTDLSKKESIDAAFAQIPDHIDCYFGIAGVSGLGTDFLTTTKIDLISNKYISECILTARMTEGGAIAYMTSTAGIGWEQDGNKRHYLPVVEAEGWDGAAGKNAADSSAGQPGLFLLQTGYELPGGKAAGAFRGQENSCQRGFARFYGHWPEGRFPEADWQRGAAARLYRPCAPSGRQRGNGDAHRIPVQRHGQLLVRRFDGGGLRLLAGGGSGHSPQRYGLHLRYDSGENGCNA